MTFKEAMADLKRSGITKDEAYEAEMYFVADASTVNEDFRPIPAWIIPYVDPWTDEFIGYEKGGKIHQFIRVRYLDPPSTKKGFKKKKQIRYSQPKDSGIHPYFPVICNKGVPKKDWFIWPEILADNEVPLIITEGEKKALVACLEGYPAIGLGGVYNFSRDGELLEALDKVNWHERPVYICYDSDAAQNAKIKVAEGRLATELSMKRGANVFIVRLPESKSGAKVGIDDYIVQHGRKAFYDLLDKAPLLRGIDKEVITLNDEVAWIEKDGLILDLKTDTWLKKDNFKSGSEYSSRIIDTFDRDLKPKRISVATAWLTHPHARRYADTIFRPGTADKAIPLTGGGIAYNRYRGLSGTSGDVTPFFDLYDYLMSLTDEFDPDLIWKTICWKVQNLGKSVNLGLMLLGDQGSGKTLFCDIISKMVAPYGTTISSNMLGSDFNEWIETSLIVIMNEAKDSSLKFNMETLRTYITDQTQACNEKYRSSRQVRNHAFYIFNSNQLKAGAFPDKDRRMIIIGCPNKHPDGDKFYGPIFKWYSNGGPKKLLHFFQNYDLEGWRPPHKAPETREKRMAYFASLTPIQKIADTMKKATQNIIFQWMSSAMSWASSEAVGAAPSQIALAETIVQSMMQIQIRPFYTPEELSLLFPSVSGTLAMGRIQTNTPAGQLSQELLQCGINYLRCEDNYDGFVHKGVTKQYLIVSDHDDYLMPITQEKFDKLMKEFPTYGEVRKQHKQDRAKKNRVSQRNKES